MSWRPKEWENPLNPCAVEVRDRDNTPVSHYEIYELGADAMFEALFQLAKDSPTGTFVIDSKEITIR